MSSTDKPQRHLNQDVEQIINSNTDDLPIMVDNIRHPLPKSTVKQFDRPLAHPNFDSTNKPSDPSRPLTDIPSPLRRECHKLDRIYTVSPLDTEDKQPSTQKLESAWDMLVSPSFASHLELLKVGGLINLPKSFFSCPDTAAVYPLLPSLVGLTVIDMSDIYQARKQLKKDGFMLSRYGLKDASEEVNETYVDATENLPEILNDVYAPDWEPILYPEHFDNGIDSINTDMLACSVALHTLSHCATRQSINKRFTTAQICRHMRSYILSQCKLYPHKSCYYRQIRLFEGHVIVAAKYLGLDLKVSKVEGKNEVYLNVSSRSSLFVRYPNMSTYFINGWQ